MNQEEENIEKGLITILERASKLEEYQDVSSWLIEGCSTFQELIQSVNSKNCNSVLRLFLNEGVEPDESDSDGSVGIGAYYDLYYYHTSYALNISWIEGDREIYHLFLEAHGGDAEWEEFRDDYLDNLADSLNN